MDTQATEQQAVSSHRDTLLLIAAVALLLGGMFAFYYFSQANMALRWLAMLAGSAAGLAAAYQTAQGKALWGYVTGARTELRKVVWPSRQESVQATLMIAVVVLIMALLLWGLDSALLWGVEKLTGRGS